MKPVIMVIKLFVLIALALSAVAVPLNSTEAHNNTKLINLWDDPPHDESVYGICRFHLQVYQECDTAGLPSGEWHTRTFSVLDKFWDVFNNERPTYNDGKRVELKLGSSLLYGAVGIQYLLAVRPFQGVNAWDTKVWFDYDGCKWDEFRSVKCGQCRRGDWTLGELDCKKRKSHDYRTHDMDCWFLCRSSF